MKTRITAESRKECALPNIHKSNNISRTAPAKYIETKR